MVNPTGGLWESGPLSDMMSSEPPQLYNLNTFSICDSLCPRSLGKELRDRTTSPASVIDAEEKC